MQWETFDGVNQQGPFTDEEVIEAIGKGMKPTTMVRPAGKANWKGLRAHAPFAAALERAQDADAVPAPVGNASGGETTFMQREDVLITNKRAVIRGTTYPLANITSVRVFAVPPKKDLFVIGLFFFCIGGFVCVTNDSQRLIGFAAALFGAACVVAHVLFLRPKHWVRVATAGGESNAIGYISEGTAQKVVQALSDAIVSRSA